MELNIAELPDLTNSNINALNNNNNNNLIKPILKSSGITNKNIKNIKPRVSYDDILAKMGMYVDNGKLHLSNEKSCNKPMECSKVKCSLLKESISNNNNIQIPQNYTTPQNSYIYNKYFKDQLKPADEPIIPKTLEEYKRMLLKKIVENKIQRQRIRQIKSTKLIMPTTNINIATTPVKQSNLNQLFRF